jgi:WD40 repeat protein
VPSRDGRGLFALGTRRSGELVRYDARAGQFLPWLGGPSIVGLDFSADGRWVTYVGLPDGILWRARADLSDRRQLTFPPRLAALPRFSPDGSRIAFSSTSPGEPSRIQVIAAEGGVPETVAPSDRSEVDVSWSPDGESLAFGLRVDLDRPDRPLTIEIVDLKTRRTAPVPGSERLFSPRWSPDGRCLAALSHDSRRLLLFDFQAGAWRELLSGEELIAYPAWSRDGRHLFVNVGPSRFRVRVVDGLRNEVASFQELRQANGPYGEWVGQGPDDSILALRDTSIQEIFALEWEQAK